MKTQEELELHLEMEMEMEMETTHGRETEHHGETGRRSAGRPKEIAPTLAG